jgi:uncharacterized protein DUF3618
VSQASTPATRSPDLAGSGQLQSTSPLQTTSPQAIQADMEATRERLAGTVDQLVYRAHPKTILKRAVDSVRARFVDANGQPRTDEITKVGGAVAGTVVVLVLIRMTVGRKH